MEWLAPNQIVLRSDISENLRWIALGDAVVL